MAKGVFYKPETAPYLNPTLDRRVVLITGGDTGIGWFTILHLYLHGYVIYLAGLSTEGVSKAFIDLQDEAQRRVDLYSEKEKAERHLGILHHIKIDLADLDSVVEAADEFFTKESRLHTLIWHAGVAESEVERTKDGFEKHMQVNFLSQFLLYLKLLPALENVVDDRKVPRVVLVSTVVHHLVTKHYKPQNDINSFSASYNSLMSYLRSKVSQIQLAKYLNRTKPEILFISVNPGTVFHSTFYDNWKALKSIGLIIKGFFSAFDATGVTNEEGSISTLRAVMDPNLTVEKDGGCFLGTGGSKGSISKIANSEEYQKELYEWSTRVLEDKKLFLSEISSNVLI